MLLNWKSKKKNLIKTLLVDMRQYIASTMPDKGGFLTISGKDFKYLSQVLRLEIGDVVWVRLPDQSLVKMVVTKIQSKQLIFKLCDEILSNYEIETVSRGVEPSSIKSNGIEFWVFQFLPKKTKMDLIIRQCVECGISRIVPVIGDFSPAVPESRNERFERLVKEARQQSGTPIDTKIENPMKLKDAISLWENSSQNSLEKTEKDEIILKNSNFSAEKNNRVAFVLHEADIAQKSLFNHLNGKCSQIKKVALAIGPEGGMSDSELQFLKDHDFNLIHFATNVLRCETACLYGIAAIQSALTEYKSWQKSE